MDGKVLKVFLLSRGIQLQFNNPTHSIYQFMEKVYLTGYINSFVNIFQILYIAYAFQLILKITVLWDLIK